MIRFKYIVLISVLIARTSYSQDFLTPINTVDRTDISCIKLTNIGKFGEIRKARTDIPKHFHTGIDIKRPTQNYTNEPIFSIGEGIVQSVRNDGPYAFIIIEHYKDDVVFWTEYEHVAEIEVRVGDFVNKYTRIARFMNKEELTKFGWQFDHFHFEILKIHPRKIKPKKTQPQYLFVTYNLICYNLETLNHYYYDPLNFLEYLIY